MRVGNITAVAERLRLVRRARRKFLRLAEIDRSLIDPMVDQLAADLGGADEPQPPAKVTRRNASGEDGISPAHPGVPPVDET